MTRHIPVLLDQVVEALHLKAGDTLIDCTVGDAGHSEVMLGRTAPDGKLLAIDADPESLLRAKKYLYEFGDRVTFVRDNFSNLEKIITDTRFAPATAIVIDLGWSSPQFSERGRGFSFEVNEPLDMRYGGEQAGDSGVQTAADILNTESEEELIKIFHRYGEEQLSHEIAAAIVAARKKKKIETTKELVEIILVEYRLKLKTDKAIPWIGGLHPATKVFQALRIAVNHELEVLRQALPQAVAALAPGGRLAVITFHSLEDRIVKHYFRSIEGTLASLVNKKPLVASPSELALNPRSSSAKLRVIEKL